MGKATEPSRKTPTSAAPVSWAIKSARAIILFLAVAALGLAGDLLSKHYVFASFLDNPELPRRMQQAGFAGHLETVDPHAVLNCAELHDMFQRQVAPGMMFTLSTNPGIVFGSELLPRWLVNVATVLTIMLVCVYFATSDRRARLMHLALACIVGGALGNLYDRLFAVVAFPAPGLEPIRGQVRDFVDLSQLYYKWVFNVADALLVIGVGLIIVEWIVLSIRHAKPAPAGKKIG